MNKEILAERMKEIEAQQQVKVTLVNQHTAAIEQLKAEWNVLNGAKLECSDWLKKLEAEEPVAQCVPPGIPA